MAEQLVNITSCSACGAEVRPNAAFCYNCGSAIGLEASSDSESASNSKSSVSNAWFEETIADEPLPENESSPVIVSTDSPANEKLQSRKIETKAKSKERAVTSTKSTANKSPRLRSAASMKQKRPVFTQKVVEAAWEQPETGINMWFVVVALVLGISGLALLVFAIFYLK